MRIRAPLGGLAAVPPGARRERAGDRDRLRSWKSCRRSLFPARRISRRPHRSAALTFGLRSVPPHVERGAFRPPRAFWILLAITPFAAMLSIVSLAFLPVYLREVAAIPLDRLGIYLGLVSVGAAGLAVAAGRFADAFGAVPALLGAAGMMAAASVLMALSGRAEPLVGIAALLLGATQAANPVVASAVERIIPPARAAQGYAIYQFAFALGFGGGGTIAGFLYDADPLLPFVATAALALPVATIVAAVLVRAGPRLEPAG